MGSGTWIGRKARERLVGLLNIGQHRSVLNGRTHPNRVVQTNTDGLMVVVEDTLIKERETRREHMRPVEATYDCGEMATADGIIISENPTYHAALPSIAVPVLTFSFYTTNGGTERCHAHVPWPAQSDPWITCDHVPAATNNS